MTIREIVAKGKGTAGHWRVEREADIDSDPWSPWEHHRLYHYGTMMLHWRIWRFQGSDYGYTDILETNLGHGSVSDQQGMNKAFQTLGAPYYYSRAGGAEIRSTWADTLPDDCDESILGESPNPGWMND